MRNETAAKILALFLMMLFLFPVVSVIVYGGLYKINNYYPETYQRYATNGKSEENIFFSREVDEKTNFTDSLVDIDFTKALKDRRLQTACKIINNNKNIVRKNLMNNKEYMNYLSDNGLTIEDLFSYTEKLEELDNNFLKSGYFIAILIIIYICVVKFGYRSQFYLIAGIVYTLHVLSQFTGMQSDSLFYYAAFQRYDTYDNYITTAHILFAALNESILTFIIFDYIFQNYGQKKEVIITNFIIQLDIFVDQIESRTITPDKLKHFWSKNSRSFYRLCKKYITKYNKNKKLDKIFGQSTILEDNQYLLIIEIKKKIDDIIESKTTNLNGYTKKLKILRSKIKLLKYKYY